MSTRQLRTGKVVDTIIMVMIAKEPAAVQVILSQSRCFWQARSLFVYAHENHKIYRQTHTLMSSARD